MNPITLVLSAAFVLAAFAAGAWGYLYLAAKFVEAAQVYENHPGALQLRAMNIIYETTKERGATILIPSSMVDSLNPALALAVAGYDAAGAASVPALKTAA